MAQGKQFHRVQTQQLLCLAQGVGRNPKECSSFTPYSAYRISCTPIATSPGTFLLLLKSSRQKITTLSLALFKDLISRTAIFLSLN
jgi:hypothetical protein